MDTGIDKEKLLRYKALAIEHLSNPMKLRLVTIFAIVIVAVIAIYMPFTKKMEELNQLIAKETERNEHIKNVEKLRKQSQMYQNRIGENTDTNEWVQYTLDGMRAFDVKRRGMESKTPKKVGPYLAITLSMEIEGTFPQLEGYIEWLEMSDRLLRLDSVRFEKNVDNLLLKVMVLGLAPKNARTS